MLQLISYPGTQTKNLGHNALHRAIDELGVDQIHRAEYRSGHSAVAACDVLHMHWPETVLEHKNPFRRVASTSSLLATVLALRLRGATVMRTIHESATHGDSNRSADVFLRRAMHALTDHYVVPSDRQRDRVPSAGRMRPIHIVPIPTNPEFVASSVHDTDLRTELDLPAGPLVGMIGRLLPYKQTPELIARFGAEADAGTTLLIAGESRDERLDRSMPLPANVILRTDPLDPVDYRRHLQAVDVAVYPYRNHENSGAVVDALSLGKHVVATPSTALADLSEAAPTSLHLHPFEGDAFFARLNELARAEPSATPSTSLPTCEDVARQLIGLYESIPPKPSLWSIRPSRARSTK